MKQRDLLLSISAAAAMFLYSGTMSIAAEHEHAVKVVKTGEVTFEKETKIGDLTLKPGRYKFDHRAVGAAHFVHFTEWSKRPTGTTLLPNGEPKAHPGEVPCKIEPLGKKISQTTIYATAEGNSERITKVEIDGENVTHLF